MKMIFLSYPESFDDEVMELMETHELKSYTKWRQVIDQGESGHPKMGTHIWPGYNTALTFIAQDEKAKQFMCDIKSFNEKTKFEGIKAMCWTLDDACWK